MLEKEGTIEKIFKFYTFQQAAYLYFEVMDEQAQISKPAPITLNKAGRNAYVKAEKERQKQAADISERYRKLCRKLANYVTDGMTEEQHNELVELSMFFMDVIDNLRLFKVRSEDRESLLAKIKQVIEEHNGQ